MRQKKKCFNGKFHQIRGIYKIIVKFKIGTKKFETSIYVFKSYYSKAKVRIDC